MRICNIIQISNDSWRARLRKKVVKNKMALRVDPNPTIPLWWAIVLMLGLLVTVINSVGQFFTLTTQQVGIVGFVAFALTALATFLTTLEEGPVVTTML